MVKTTVSDVVSPTVTTEDPYGLLVEVRLLCKDCLCLVTATSFESSDESLCSILVLCAVFLSIQPSLSSCLYVFLLCVCCEICNLSCQVFPDLVLSDEHTKSVLCVIFEE